MTTANHALAGSTIAIAIGQPLLALPLAVVSHFVLDALPHYGYDGAGYEALFKHKATYLEVVLDVVGIGLLLLLFPHHWWVWAGAFCGVLPDLEWVYRYMLFERHDRQPPSTFITRFHQRIQWCERPWGIYMEVIFFVAIMWLAWQYILPR